MSKPEREEKADGQAIAGDAASVFESGVVPRGLVFDDEGTAAQGGAPPWDVVNAYLTNGDHRLWVETHAARSPAFAEVLAALRNDRDEARARAQRGVVVPFRRR